jgi:PAS domain S-box-containing protein
VLRFKFDTIFRLVFEGGIWEQKGEKLMNLIVFFDLVTFLTSLVALIILLIGWKCTLERDVKLLIAGLLICTLLYSFCLVLEWSGITSALDPFEDLIGALIPMWWAFLFYAILQQIAGLDLRQSEERHRSFIHKIQAAVVVHDADTRIIACNSKAQELLGLTEYQMLGKTAIDPDWKFLNADGERMSLKEYPVNQVLATRQPLRDLITGIYSPNKVEQVWVLVYADPVLDYKGNIQQVIVTFMDITEHKRAEEEREKLIKELQEALKEIKTLRGILPLCSFCKKIRDDKGYWEQVDVYIYKHLQADISHSLCPDCGKEHYPDLDIHE